MSARFLTFISASSFETALYIPTRIPVAIIAAITTTTDIAAINFFRMPLLFFLVFLDFVGFFAAVFFAGASAFFFFISPAAAFTASVLSRRVRSSGSLLRTFPGFDFSSGM